MDDICSSFYRPEGEDPNTPLRIMTESCTATTQAMIKYLYTDSLETQEITEDLMSLAEKYQLGQLKEQARQKLGQLV